LDYETVGRPRVKIVAETAAAYSANGCKLLRNFSGLGAYRYAAIKGNHLSIEREEDMKRKLVTVILFTLFCLIMLVGLANLRERVQSLEGRVGALEKVSATR